MSTKSSSSPDRVIQVCPSVEELESASEYYCSESSCAGVKFKNPTNLEMHRVKHHKFSPIPTDVLAKREFYCPIPTCTYNLSAAKGHHFSSRKYLKQHFQKVHAKKVFECCVCEKKFATVVLRENHERTCGNFTCPQCGFNYKSKESLSSHIRRKHNGNVSTSGLKRNRLKGVQQSQPDAGSSTSEIGIQTGDVLIIGLGNVEAGTQCENVVRGDIEPSGDSLSAQFIDNYCQTMNAEGYFDSFECFQSGGQSNGGGAMSSIETQTDLLDDLIQNESLMSSIYNSNDRHTQTCEEILTELLVNDIETQTMWSGITADCNADLAVSTETQTGLFDMVNNSIQTQTTDVFFGDRGTSTSTQT